MLSTAQDHRKASAEITPHLASYPGTKCRLLHYPPRAHCAASPNYWEGSGIFPRSVQIKNMNIPVYNITTFFWYLHSNQGFFPKRGYQ